MNIIVIELEPTPYKYDLWNSFSNFVSLKHIVYFTQFKNWSNDAGHNYKDLPPAKFNYLILEGRSVLNSLFLSIRIIIKIIIDKNSFVFICGYSHLVTLLCIIFSIIVKRRFVVFADAFNTNNPVGKYGKMKKFLRNILRSLIFKHSKVLLVCGRNGIETARLAGCADIKLLDFPYVVDVERILGDVPELIPNACIESLSKNLTILFFSGRMIQRKGLETLLKAISMTNSQTAWCLWIEGDGLEINRYKKLALNLGIIDKCSFLGFCQYRLHSWLLRNSSIIIIPSLDDNWGIVVDEALQLGKVVISTDKTGSAIDRISHGINGLIFSAGDHVELSKYLEMTLNNKNFREQLQQNALNKTKFIKPQDNVRSLINLVYE